MAILQQYVIDFSYPTEAKMHGKSMQLYGIRIHHGNIS